MKGLAMLFLVILCFVSALLWSHWALPEHEREEIITVELPKASNQKTPLIRMDTWTSEGGIDVQLAIEEVMAIALTLSGECYNDKPHDKRLVAEVILNRVSHENFGDSVVIVVSTPGQFDGYWNQSRDVTVNDVEIAEQTLRDWYAGGCKPLSEWLYFEAGDNRENVFRKQY